MKWKLLTSLHIVNMVAWTLSLTFLLILLGLVLPWLIWGHTEGASAASVAAYWNRIGISVIALVLSVGASALTSGAKPAFSEIFSGEE